MTNIEYENNRFLDVVNDNDEIINSRLRTDIHRLGLLHREIHLWMFDKNKNIFFQKRGLHTATAGLLGATVAGHVDRGEEYITAAVRETKEETGISVYPSDLVLVKKLKAPNIPENLDGEINNFFRCLYIYKKPIDEKMLKKEEGIPGAGFQKFSYQFLMNLPPKHRQLFVSFVLKEELPYVLEYLRTWKS